MNARLPSRLPSSSLLSCLVLSSVLAVTVGCGSGHSSSAPTPRFVSGVDHPYFPIAPASERTYEGMDEGRWRVEVASTLPQKRDITGVLCTAITQDIYLDGELNEVTTEWYAQDLAGAVWKFGEESFELDEGEMVLSEDTWLAGQGEGRAWMAFPPDPLVAHNYFGYSPEGEEEYLVTSVTRTVKVPAGTFGNCLEIVEDPNEPNDQDIILYARGVGRVSEKSSGGKIVLVSNRRK